MISPLRYCDMLLLINLILEFVGGANGITGGVEIEIEMAPYQVNYGDVCGGALIQERWALTTAHCGKHEFIRAGDKYRLRGIKVNIEKHFPHSEFGNKHEFDFDIQLLKLDTPLDVTVYVKPIAISDLKISEVEHILVAGWGYPKEKSEYTDLLHQTKLRIVPKDRCQAVDLQWFNHTLTKNMFCAGGLKGDACQGDSGSGAVFEGRLVGISSFGYGCARALPGVYVSVTQRQLRTWIRRLAGV